ncbi:hypothetical protein KPL76_09950 [Subtercola sp. PAMC28395]|uniref:hypothetical protein n=1 Tax=Subtercola sp. PAMC28395 TaxID=2846775 RepID=UPI001C0CDDC0|nr:hypothetical protein [Subtercola sp. PAMC28395]QWT23080.1 hypothetical protein KPL76_09950 [Subtercola sp. PAMC28395]
MTSEANEPTGQGTLLPRLGLIEDQPLEARAAAYVQLHDELRIRLEGGDVAATRG